MRENRSYGSEGRVLTTFPYPFRMLINQCGTSKTGQASIECLWNSGKNGLRSEPVPFLEVPIGLTKSTLADEVVHQPIGRIQRGHDGIDGAVFALILHEFRYFAAASRPVRLGSIGRLAVGDNEVDISSLL